MTGRSAIVGLAALAAVVALAACSTGLSSGSKATASKAPNVDVYLMLDTSPSMEIEGTSAGMAALRAATPNEMGCAFGCHESDPTELTAIRSPGAAAIGCQARGVYADGTAFDAGSKFPSTGRDLYDLSRCLGAPLRIDLVREAVRDLVNTAAQSERIDGGHYRMALYENDSNQGDPAADLALFPLQPLTGDLATARRAAAEIAPLEVYRNNLLVKGDFNDDMDTFLDADISAMNGLIPAPGSGADSPDQMPRGVLFIVTDGLNDQTPRRTYSPMDWSGVNCAAVKKRGVRIAVLYTTYEPGNDPWYLYQVAPRLPKGLPPGLPPSTPVGSDPMALAARQCASPGLYEQVGTNGDISAEMRTLFERAIQTAGLTAQR